MAYAKKQPLVATNARRSQPRIWAQSRSVPARLRSFVWRNNASRAERVVQQIRTVQKINARAGIPARAGAAREANRLLSAAKSLECRVIPAIISWHVGAERGEHRGAGVVANTSQGNRPRPPGLILSGRTSSGGVDGDQRAGSEGGWPAAQQATVLQHRARTRCCKGRDVSKEFQAVGTPGHTLRARVQWAAAPCAASSCSGPAPQGPP